MIFLAKKQIKNISLNQISNNSKKLWIFAQTILTMTFVTLIEKFNSLNISNSLNYELMSECSCRNAHFRRLSKG